LKGAGANPTNHPSPKNKKAIYNYVPVATLPNVSPTKALGKAERMCKWPKFVTRNSNAFIIRQIVLGLSIPYEKKVVGGLHEAVCLNSKTLKGYCCSGANPPTPPTRLETAYKSMLALECQQSGFKPLSIPMRVGWGFTPHRPFYSAGITYLGATQPHSPTRLGTDFPTEPSHRVER
jgi:hypothetical protein